VSDKAGGPYGREYFSLEARTGEDSRPMGK
jgi:hypothetical protein